MLLTLSQATLNVSDNTSEKIPKDHRLDVSSITQQTLGVFSHMIRKIPMKTFLLLLNIFFVASNTDSVVPETEKLFMEGHIKEKLEYRPCADDTYMQLKLESIRKASVPARQIKHLDKIVQNYKPVSDHKHNVSQINVEQHRTINSLVRMCLKNV